MSKGKFVVETLYPARTKKNYVPREQYDPEEPPTLRDMACSRGVIENAQRITYVAEDGKQTVLKDRHAKI
jgi:hypothetical protein